MKQMLEQWQAGMKQLAEAARVLEAVATRLEGASQAETGSDARKEPEVDQGSVATGGTPAPAAPELGAGLLGSADRVATEERGERTRAGGAIQKITAAVEEGADAAAQRGSLEGRLAEAEQVLARLEAKSLMKEQALGASERARKTLPAATVQLLAKQGLEAGDAVDIGSLDAALAGMSVEHRIAVKSQMLRAGTLTP